MWTTFHEGKNTMVPTGIHLNAASWPSGTPQETATFPSVWSASAPLIPNHYQCCHFCFHWPDFSLPENETGPVRIPRIPEPLPSICGSNLSIHSIKTNWFYIQLLLVLFSFAHLVLYLGFLDFPFSFLKWRLSFLMHPVNPTSGLNLNAVCPAYSFLALDLCKAGTLLTLLLSPYFTLNRMF